MSKIDLTTIRDWTGLIASVATVLFLMFYPHGPSAEAHGDEAYHATTAGPLTAALFAPGDADRR